MLWIALKEAFLRRSSLHGGRRHVEKAREVLGRFTRYCDPVNLDDIDQVLYEKYLARRKKDISRKTGLPVSIASLNGDIRYLNSCFKYAAELNRDKYLIPEDWDAPRVKRLRQPKKRPRTVSLDQTNRVMDSCRYAKQPRLPGCSPEQWWQTLLLVNYYTFIRCEALLGLPRPTEDELSRNELIVPAEVDKSDVDRVFYIPDALVAKIRRMPARPGEILFSWPFCRRYFYTIADQFQKAAGLQKHEKVLTHDLRRSGCTNMIRSGANMVTVQRQMGHSDPKILADSYAGELTEEQRQAVDLLPVPAIVTESKSDTRQLAFNF